MRFDVKKAKDLLCDTIFLVRDHDNQFQFCGILKPSKPDELTFYIVCPADVSKIRGTYAFPVGSNFTMYKMEFDLYKKEWEYTSTAISWKDIIEKDDTKEEEMKEEKDMKLDDAWKDCVINKDNAWTVNDQIKVGDTIYRIKSDTIDIKGKMTIAYTSYYNMMHVEFNTTSGGTDSINIEITPDMWVFKTDSQNDPGILVQHHDAKFNPELRVGKLYHVTNSDFQYMIHVKSITDDSIGVDIIETIRGLDNKSLLILTDKTFDIAKLLEYKFKEI